MSWDRAKVAAALVDVIGAATAVKIHERPPELLNPPCVVISRPQPVTYGVAGMSIDEASLPVVIVGGIETEDGVEDLKNTVRQALSVDPGLGGVVQSCVPTEERNWRNVTGAGGIQLLLVEVVLTVQM